jgi:lysozyme
MTPRYRVSRAAIELITRFEGYRRKAAQLPDGRWMIGYGHTLTAREGAEVSTEDAEALLIYDLIGVAHAINEWTYAPLTQNQFDALASFVFNIGLESFRRSSVLKRLNEGALIQAACAMELWRRAEFGGEKIVVDALVRRRAAEKALFLTPPDGWPVAPSPILRPLLDADGAGLVPRQAPAEVTAVLEDDEIQIVRTDAPLPAPAPAEDEAASPVKAAAEAVAARLETIFAEPAPETESAEGQAPQSQAELSADAEEAEVEEAPPLATVEAAPLEGEAAVAEPAFELVPPAEEAPETRAALLPQSVEAEADGAPAGELFPPPANDARAQAAQPSAQPLSEAPGEPERGEGERILIDDTAPFEFVGAMVQPLPHEPRASLFSLVLLAVIGLAFFGGGVFWAMNARATMVGGRITPLMVGMLAGLAGVGLVSVAVFLILKRLWLAERD